MSAPQFTPWQPATDQEREVYAHYFGGSERGDLYGHVKRGRMGILKPARSESNAFAAWMAGHDLNAKLLADAAKDIAKARGDA